MEMQISECIARTLHEAMAREREQGNLREKEQWDEKRNTYRIKVGLEREREVDQKN